MPALTPFTYDSRNIRVIERDGEAWFVAADFDAAVDTLVSEGRIVATPTTVGRVGRPSLVFSRREH